MCMYACVYVYMTHISYVGRGRHIYVLYFLTHVLDKIPIAVVYATWSGLGIFTIAIFGYIFFKQNLSWQVMLGLFFIVVGVVLVNSFSSKVI